MVVGAQLLQASLRIIASPSPARRAAPKSSNMAMSAVASVSTSGVLLTMRPRSRAAPRSMCSYPTEKVAMARTLAGNRAINSAGMGSVAQTKSASAPWAAATNRSAG